MTNEKKYENPFTSLDDLEAAVGGINRLGLRPEGVKLPSLSVVLENDGKPTAETEEKSTQPAVIVDAMTGKRRK